MLRAIVLMLGLAASVFATASAQGVGTPRVGASAPAAGPTLYVSTTGKDNDAAYDGSTPQKAFLTVAKAVSAAASGATISIAAGRYVEAPLMLTKSLTLSGPQVSSEVSEQLPPLPPIDTLCQKQACITTDGASDSSDRVINISPAASGPPAVTLANLVILGPDMSKRPTKSSYGIVVDAVPVTVQDVTVVAGAGGPGAPGDNGGAAPAKGGGGYRQGGICWQKGDGGCDCTKGDNGGDQKDDTGKVVASGGSGGGIVLNSCPVPGEVNRDGPPNGADGGPGGAGPRGAGGSAADTKDERFVRSGGLLMFQGSVAGKGGTGITGASGGSGGPGGTRNYTVFLCFPFNSYAMGGGGGNGGDGGAPGSFGSGGGQGGGAFGLIVADAVVSGTRLSIYGGKGGPGGVGGQGGAGSPGVAGGPGRGGTTEGCDKAGSHVGGTGGKGGPGGPGGAGGGGAGGDGGPSIDVVLIGSAKLSGSQPATRGGTGGGGGGGGAAGPNGPLAKGGVTGQQKSSAQYTLK